MMEQWTEAHPHLAELARLHRCLEEAFADAVGVNPCVRPDAAFFAQAGELLRQVLTVMSAEGLPEQFCQQCSQLREQVQREPKAAARLIEDVVGANPCVRPDATEEGQAQGPAPTASLADGLARFFVWKLLAELLAPLRERLERRLPELAWEEPICPLCGAGPSMAQLVRTSTGRKRLLVCGCCAMRWEYKRIGCPHCGNEEQSQLSIIEPEDEPFRIDCCQQCKGYIKTYTGKDDDGLMLADWSSLHLDALAMQQGWQRQAESLYSL